MQIKDVQDRLQELPLNCNSIIMTLEFCFASSEDCILLLDPVCKQKLGLSFGIVSLFLLIGRIMLELSDQF